MITNKVMMNDLTTSGIKRNLQFYVKATSILKLVLLAF